MFNSIALINFCLPAKNNSQLAIPQGLVSLATMVEKHNYSPQIYDFAKDIKYDSFSIENINNKLNQIEEDVIGVSLWDSILPKALICLSIYKEKYPNKILIIGGPSASSVGINIMEKFQFIDFCVKGEGEDALISILKFVNSSKNEIDLLAENVLYRDKKIIKCGKSKLINNTFPILQYNNYNISEYNRFEVSSSRGCQFNCSFCSVKNSVIKHIQFRNIEDIIAEIKILLEVSKCDRIHFIDDNFCINKKRFCKIIDSVNRLYPNLLWSCYLRIDDLTMENVDYLKEKNCYGVFIGLETKNPSNNISINKKLSSEVGFDRIQYASKKLKITLSFIWGFPNETVNDLIDTLNFITDLSELPNIFINIYQLTFLTGTLITKQNISLLRYNKNYISHFLYPPYLDQLSIEEEELIKNNPEIFSAFFSLNSEEFFLKSKLVNEYLN